MFLWDTFSLVTVWSLAWIPCNALPAFSAEGLWGFHVLCVLSYIWLGASQHQCWVFLSFLIAPNLFNYFPVTLVVPVDIGLVFSFLGIVEKSEWALLSVSAKFIAWMALKAFTGECPHPTQAYLRLLFTLSFMRVLRKDYWSIRLLLPWTMRMNRQKKHRTLFEWWWLLPLPKRVQHQ